MDSCYQNNSSNTELACTSNKNGDSDIFLSDVCQDTRGLISCPKLNKIDIQTPYQILPPTKTHCAN